MPETQSKDLITAHAISAESFLTKPNTWDGYLRLADLLMGSVTTNVDQTPASPGDSNPELHAEGDLRRHDTQAQRDRILDGPLP